MDNKKRKMENIILNCYARIYDYKAHKGEYRFVIISLHGIMRATYKTIINWGLN